MDENVISGLVIPDLNDATVSPRAKILQNTEKQRTNAEKTPTKVSPAKSKTPTKGSPSKDKTPIKKSPEKNENSLSKVTEVHISESSEASPEYKAPP